VMLKPFLQGVCLFAVGYPILAISIAIIGG
jgi:hypothetical protein